jgi:hypothetical protein
MIQAENLTRKASAQHQKDPPVAGNARLTGATGAVLLLLFCVEVATAVMGVKGMLTLHVMIGLLLVPPLLVKISSVSWRFLQYYRHNEAYQRRGATPTVLRILGPLLLLATIVLFVSGITLLLAPAAFGGPRGTMYSIHAGSFYVFFCPGACPRDWPRPRPAPPRREGLGPPLPGGCPRRTCPPARCAGQPRGRPGPRPVTRGPCRHIPEHRNTPARRSTSSRYSSARSDTWGTLIGSWPCKAGPYHAGHVVPVWDQDGTRRMRSIVVRRASRSSESVRSARSGRDSERKNTALKASRSALAAQCTEEAFADRVHPGSLNGGPQDPGACRLEDGVEGLGEV